jgi:hypothetical protein
VPRLLSRAVRQRRLADEEPVWRRRPADAGGAGVLSGKRPVQSPAATRERYSGEQPVQSPVAAGETTGAQLSPRPRAGRS